MEKTRKKSNQSLLGLLIAQFFGAFNDNAWKVMVFTLATRPLVNQIGNGTPEFETSSQLLATLSLVVFLLPMMLFSLPAGAIADRFSKRTVIVITKILEVVLMAGAALSLYFAPTALVLPFFLLGCMGVQSGLFGPAKYGIMPELLTRENLSKGNGLLEMWTMLAIIAGTGMGPLLLMADNEGTNPSWTWTGAALLALLSFVGLFGSFAIKKVPPASQNQGKISVVNSLKDALSAIRKDNVVWLAVWGSVCYWLTTSLLGQNVLVYAKVLVQDFERGEMFQGFPPASYGVGIGIGAMMSGRLSGERIEYGFIPLGAIGFALGSLLLGLIQPGMAGTIALLIFMGASSGLLLVPLHAIVQWRSPDDKRGSIIALGNFLDVIGMIIGSLVAGGMALLGFNLKMMLIFSAFLVIGATAWAIHLLPKALVRLCFIILTRTLYKIKIVGVENVPKEGPALLVANHISIIDALFVMASVNRPVRFLMNETYYNHWFFRPLARLMEAIPVASSTNPRLLLESLKVAGKALDEGHVLCIFPEGQISHNGRLLSFKRGIELLTKDRDCPVVPVYIANVWGSIFTYKDGRFFSKWPRPFPYKITITYGQALPSQADVAEVRKAIRLMEHDSWLARKDESLPLHHQLIKKIRAKPFNLMLANKSEQLSARATLNRVLAWGHFLKPFWKNEQLIGIWLPTDIPSTVVNIAATIAGKTIVNINPHGNSDEVLRTVSQAGIKVVVTSKEISEKIALSWPESISKIYIDDMMHSISPSDRLQASFVGWCGSIRAMERYCGSHGNSPDTFTILFTSGSTGQPKGVALSNFNIASNIESVSQILPHLGKKKNVLTAMPYSHSFGYMLLWLSLHHGITLVTHPDPRASKEIGMLAKKYAVKMMMTTPGALEEYTKAVLPEHFGSLKCVFTGADKLSEEVSDAFESRFGLRPLEGYGATECSPVIAASTLDVRQAGIFQIGSIKGSVGQPIPGVLAKIVCPETFAELPPGNEGLLLVKGPNIMQGYVGDELLTKSVMRDGWYITGDIAVMNAEEFITIKGRKKT